MSDAKRINEAEVENSKIDGAKVDNTATEEIQAPKEVGGRGGLDPTRYGDWEIAGRCVDF